MEVQPSFPKTKVCKFWIAGKCKAGPDCSFAHGESELRPMPTVFMKTKLCKYFVSGKCQHGEACAFAHGEHELSEQVEVKKSNTPCRKFMTGRCARSASECRFLHSEDHCTESTDRRATDTSTLSSLSSSEEGAAKPEAHKDSAAIPDCSSSCCSDTLTGASSMASFAGMHSLTKGGYASSNDDFGEADFASQPPSSHSALSTPRLSAASVLPTSPAPWDDTVTFVERPARVQSCIWLTADAKVAVELALQLSEAPTSSSPSPWSVASGFHRRLF